MHYFEDKDMVQDPVLEYSDALRRIPLIIDNGSYTCKAGWACFKDPKLIFRNLIAKARVKKEGDFNGSLIGNDIVNLESMKWNLKTQFDRDVVTHFETQEQIFDYTFSHLGINTEGSVNHPIVITEAVCNPNPFRQGMSELLFECYSVPSVAYGIDSLFSFNHNMNGAQEGLIISSGHAATHILPFQSGRVDIQNCKRICIGGFNSNAYMQRLIQLKHPSLALAVTLPRTQELIKKHTYMASNYDEELARWRDGEFSKENKRTIQLPYIRPEPTVQRDPEKEKEKRIRQGRRLQELNARKREEKLANEEKRYKMLLQVDQLQQANPAFFQIRLKEIGLGSSKELYDEINELKTVIKNRREKILNQAMDDGQTTAKKLKEDTQLEKQRPTDGMTDEEIEAWVEDLRKERMDILEKRKLRDQRKQELSNRKSHASKERMRILSKLAAAENSSKRQKSEDTFGMNDEDWEVYKYISKEGSDSEDEHDQERLNEIESLLSEHDLEFIRDSKSQEQPHQDLSVYYQLHLGVERIRVPEIIYQPCLLGLEQAGLAETLDYVLKRYPIDVQNKLVQRVFVTGGNTKFEGFKIRLENELRAMRPFQSTFKLHFAADPELDAWRGVCEWVRSIPNLSAVSINRTEYEECGEGYLKEHQCSNFYFPTPVTI